MAGLLDLFQPNSGYRAPTYDLNTASGRGALNMTLGAAGAGYRSANGLAAFMPQGWNLGSLSGPGGMDGNQHIDNGTAPQDIMGMARAMGFDTSKYNLQDSSDLISADYDARSRANGLNTPRTSGLGQLYNDMNAGELGRYSTIGGLSTGWGEDQDPAHRQAARTIYRDNGQGSLQPVHNSNFYHAEENPGWVRGEGADTISALSMMMPAFGGWAGVLGNGAAGSLSAGSGLGLTSGLSSAIGTGATNALVGAGVSGLTGGGWRGALNSLVGSGIGAGVNSAMGGNGLSGMFDTAGSGAATPFSALGNFGGLSNRFLGASQDGQLFNAASRAAPSIAQFMQGGNSWGGGA